MVAYEVELGPQSLAAIKNLTEALKGFKGATAETDAGLMTRKEAAKFLGISPPRRFRNGYGQGNCQLQSS